MSHQTNAFVGISAHKKPMKPKHTSRPRFSQHAQDTFYLCKTHATWFIKCHEALTNEDVVRVHGNRTDGNQPPILYQKTNWNGLASTMYLKTGKRQLGSMWKQFFQSWLDHVASGHPPPRKAEAGKLLLYNYCLTIWTEMKEKRDQIEQSWQIKNHSKGLVDILQDMKNTYSEAAWREDERECAAHRAALLAFERKEDWWKKMQEKNDEKGKKKEEEERRRMKAQEEEERRLMKEQELENKGKGNTERRLTDENVPEDFTKQNGRTILSFIRALQVEEAREKELLERNERVKNNESVWVTCHGSAFRDDLFNIEEEFGSLDDSFV